MTANLRRVIARLPAEPGAYRFRDGRGRTLGMDAARVWTFSGAVVPGADSAQVDGFRCT
jgi:hypothetical protein